MTSPALAQAEALWRSGQRQQAQIICESLAGAEPAALSMLADMHAAAGSPTAAIECLQRLARLHDGDAVVHRRLGNAQLACGHCAEAASSYRASMPSKVSRMMRWMCTL